MKVEEKLSQKTLGQLVDLADKLKIKVHHRAGKDTIAKAIMQQPIAVIVAALEDQTKVETQPLTIGHKNKPEDIIKALEPFALQDKGEGVFENDKGFRVQLLPDHTWIFKCRGEEESGNMDIPLTIIKRRAEFVSKGRRALVGIDKSTFGSLNPGAKSAYTDVVLSA